MKRKVVFLLIAAVLSWGYVYAQSLHHDMGIKKDFDKAMPQDYSASQTGGLGVCPVMHDPASKEYSYSYQGKTYYFCCSACADAFKNDPQKYISKIKEIPIEAYQYGFEPSTIKVKKGDIVRFIATSRDVEHGIAITAYNINVRVSKGQAKKIEFLADKAGQFDITCSVYCGPGHMSMKAKFIVTE